MDELAVFAIKGLPGVQWTRAAIVTETCKETPVAADQMRNFQLARGENHA